MASPTPTVPKPEMPTALSPRVDRTEAEIDFFDAIRAVLKGERVTRLEWADPAYFCLLHNSRLTLHKPDDKLYSWIIGDGDMAGEDWVVL